jgi:peptide-methionine (S)-S-oxide reductase
METNSANNTNQINQTTDTATLAAGCFWCVEAVFVELKGVISVTSGYCNGKIKNPTYREVCSGLTGHAEACQIVYDPAIISFEQLLEVFFTTHNPTTLNQQGGDRGTQYRSGIYYHNENQKNSAEKVLKLIDESKAYDAPIVTEIAAIEPFYIAEEYHQDYYQLNPNQGYCQMVIQPKMEKFRKVFDGLLKK